VQKVQKSHGGKELADAVRQLYREGQSDYSLEPLVRVDEHNRPLGRIQDGDAVIFCCRRGEREIELTEAFTDPDFSHFGRRLLDLDFVILTLYHEKFKDLPVAFLPSRIPDTLGEVVSRAGLRQFRCAESEKYAHVTFFLNGANSQPFPGEVDVRIPSPKGIPFDQIPEMSLPQVADAVAGAVKAGYDLIVTNFANGDVIGHTANEAAKVQCARAVDEHLGRGVAAAREHGYVVLITADHGNLEVMRHPDGTPHVAHTTSPVALIVIDPLAGAPVEVNNGCLADLAPTVLEILDLPRPAAMSAKPLVAGHAWGKGRRVLLIILDGWGLGAADATNPIHLAETPVWDGLLERYGFARLQASGEAVGLQAGKPGNSEAGHLNIGAGRVVLQDDVRLDQALKDGSFHENEIFLRTIDGAIRRKTRLHLIGLLTEKSSHGSIDYPLALLRMARSRGLEDVFLHLIFDGRSTEPGSAPALLQKLETQMAEIGAGQIAGGVGRGIALDRDGNYDRIQRAYLALTDGVGRKYPRGAANG
jgi:2,3-bisphosphoglycerate-independent phosphoglycerate mutase